MMRTSFGFGEPATAHFFCRNAGKIRLEIENWRLIEHVDAAHIKKIAIAAEKFDYSKPDGIRTARRARRKDSVRKRVDGRSADEIVSLGAVEEPENEEMREAFDVSKASFELRQDFEDAFGIVLRVQSLGNLFGVGVGSFGVSDWAWSEHGLILIAPAEDKLLHRGFARINTDRTSPGLFFSSGFAGVGFGLFARGFFVLAVFGVAVFLLS
jgi:hypothetical protein